MERQHLAGSFRFSNAFAFVAGKGAGVPDMNDINNLLIAYFSTASSVFAAIEAPTVITIISAIVLPILFFAIGKTIDVLLQVYLDRRNQNRER